MRRPEIRVEELPAVVTAVGHTRTVESRMRMVEVFLSVAFHEEVNRHYSCPLQDEGGETKTQTFR